MPGDKGFHFRVGDRVKVVRGSKYRGGLIGLTGTVKCVYGSAYSDVAVTIDGRINKYSTSGYFYVSRFALELIEEDNTMPENTNNYNAELPMPEGYTRVEVKFLSGSNKDVPYTYALYDPIPILREGDLLVVRTAHHGYALAKFVRCKTEPDDTPIHWRTVIAKVDLTNHLARVDRAKEVVELKKKMDEKVHTLQQLAVYELLAEKDADLANLLSDYKRLAGLN